MKIGPLSRRSFLARLAPAAGAVALTPISAVANAVTRADETPALIAFGARFRVAVTTMRDAFAARQTAMALVERTVPILPDALIVTKDHNPVLRSYAVEIRAIDGRALPLETYKGADGKSYAHRPQHMFTVEGLDAYEADHAISSRSKIGRWLKATRSVAVEYEAAYEAACKAAGIGEALEAHCWAQDTVIRLARDCETIPALTIRGAALKALAIDVLLTEIVCDEHQAFVAKFAAGQVSGGLAKDILRQAGEVA